MPNALSFISDGDLIARLKTVDWKGRIEQIHHSREDLGLLTAIYQSVGSSTFRAFRVFKDRRPSAVFRNCISNELFEGGFLAFRCIKTNEDYRRWAFRLARKVQKNWREQLNAELDFPRALKLVNLLAKGLCTVSPLWPNLSHAIAGCIDVPLDQYSLRPLAYMQDFSYLANASMGSVEDQREYNQIQRAIRRLCDKVDFPPIAYDFLTWDSTHRSVR